MGSVNVALAATALDGIRLYAIDKRTEIQMTDELAERRKQYA